MASGVDFLHSLRKKSSQQESLKSFLKKTITSGKFYRFTLRKRTNLLLKYFRLTRNTKQLKWRYELAALGGSILALSTSHDAIAQNTLGPFVIQSRPENPLRNPLNGYRLRQAAVDLDNDGDYDIVASNTYSFTYGFLKVFRNVGNATEPAFIEEPFLDANGYQITTGSPAFADLDGDGDMDMALSNNTTTIRYFLNESGEFTQKLDGENPFNDISIGGFPTIDFVNFDGDGDMDLLIGDNYGKYYSISGRLRYFENDGDGLFAEATPPLLSAPIVGYAFRNPTAHMADLDEDGNFDVLVGTHYGVIMFFKGNGSTYEEQTEEWDPILKTGNPFYGVDLGSFTNATMVDLDGDADLDVLVGYRSSSSSRNSLAFFENTGNAVFEQRELFDNPFDGVNVRSDADPFFVDVDDDGQVDAILGGKYDEPLTYLRNNNGVFEPVAEEDNPFAGLSFSYSGGAKPAFADIDNDGDSDLVTGSWYGGVRFFLNNEGVLELQPDDETNPFFQVNNFQGGGYYYYNSTISLVDIDNDGDVDLFSGNNNGTVDFFPNVGTAEEPLFEVPVDPETNPLDGSLVPEFQNDLFDNSRTQPRFVDIDHDGDFDLLLGSYYYISSTETEVSGVFLFENTGSPSAPVFEFQSDFFIEGNYQSNPGFIDVDGDGDLDLFIGDSNGSFEFFLNTNPAAVTTLSTTTIDYQFGDSSVPLDANLTLSDGDDDNIIRATVSIQNFQTGIDILGFTTQSPVTADFDSSTGVLTLQGKAPIATYQAILRSITYAYTGPDPGARKGGRTKAVSRTVVFQTFDADLTMPVSASRTITISSPTANQPPSISAITLNTVIQGSASIDLAPLITDDEGNFDPGAAGALAIVAQPQSGASASLSGTVLSINYTGLSFVGNDDMQIQVCDIANACTNVTINVTVAGDVVVYNGISPNGDGFNQFFNVDNIEFLSPENKVSIFNRWGDKVFEVDNYNNDNRRFEGRSDDGKDLPSGVYFYRVELSNGLPKLEGYLTLKR